MDLAQPQRIDMKQTMADKAGLLSELAVAHGFRKAPYVELVSVGYGILYSRLIMIVFHQ